MSPPSGLTWLPIGPRATVAQALRRLGRPFWESTGKNGGSEPGSMRRPQQRPRGASSFRGPRDPRDRVPQRGPGARQPLDVRETHRRGRGPAQGSQRADSPRPRPQSGLAAPRSTRARWRTRVVDDGRLRWIRTSITGRAPGFAPGPPVAGPWRPILLERRTGLALEDCA